MPISEETLQASVLGRAIDEASNETVRAVLKSTCAKSDEARKEAESRLVAVTTDAKDEPEAAKTPVPRYAVCVNCEKEFDVTTNTKKSCRYHPMNCEPTGEELWEDNYDEFEVDTEEAREELPHCFTFGCCHGNLEDNPEGCVIDFHEEPHSNKKPAKRARAC